MDQLYFDCEKYIQGARGTGARFLKLSPASVVSPIMTKFSQYTPHFTCYSVPCPFVHLWYKKDEYVSILYMRSAWGLKHSPISDGQMYGARVFQPSTAHVKWNQLYNFFKRRMISVEEKTICCKIQLCYPEKHYRFKKWFSNKWFF